jgi:hypothetical protein
MGLPRRIQGIEQEVCQLLLAALGQKSDANWQKVAGWLSKMTKSHRI